MSMVTEWDGPDPREFMAVMKVGYSYDRRNPTLVSTHWVSQAIRKALPQIEKILKQATKVTYKLTNSSHRGTHLFYYIAPRFSTDYIVLEANVKSDSLVELAMNWVPYEPGTRTIDFSNMITKKIHSKVPRLAGPYAVRLTKELARAMPHLEKVARLQRAVY